MPTQPCEEISLSFPPQVFDHKSQSCLYNLPEELQSMIYKFAITRSEPFMVVEKNKTSTRIVTQVDLVLCHRSLYFYTCNKGQPVPELTTFTSLSLVCKKLHRLVSGDRLLFKFNVFDMHHLDLFPRIGQYNTAGITSITLRWFDTLRGQAEEEYLRKIRAECPNLEHLRLLAVKSLFGKPEKPTKDLSEPYHCKIPIEVTGELFAFRGLKSFEYTFDILERDFRVWFAINVRKFWRRECRHYKNDDLNGFFSHSYYFSTLQRWVFMDRHELVYRETLQRLLSTYVESLVKLPRAKHLGILEIATPVQVRTHYLDFDAQPLIKDVCDKLRTIITTCRTSSQEEIPF